MSAQTDFEAVSEIGTLLATFGDEDLAKAWARENAKTFPGVRVERVTVTETREHVYRPRPRLAAVDGERVA